MTYMLLIVEPRGQRRERSLEQGREVYARMLSYADDLKARGLLLGADALKSDGEGVRVEVRAGKRRMLDGPFAETKEMVGGYFLIDCASRDEAAAIAAECPAAEWATVEVREVGTCYQ
ncbi:MAG: YciI family protein [Rhodanobacteraceae bacterium]